MKGYPKSRFEIVNQSQIQDIETVTSGPNVALYMQPYTSNKGTEDWELLYGLDGFTKAKGGISFNKHGQAQLTVAQALRSGAYVFGKRLVSEDASLANITVMARPVVVSNTDDATNTTTDTTYLYIYANSVENCADFETACEEGIKGVAETDIPLFTVAPMGRGESLSYFRLNPEYSIARSKKKYGYARYSFEVIEDNESLESIMISMNPEVILDGAAQAMNPKIKSESNQVRVKLYEDSVYKLVGELAKTSTDSSGNPIGPEDLINMDFINGCDAKGNAIPGIISINNTKEASKEYTAWGDYTPSDITVVDISNADGIHLANGSYGTMTASPMSQPAELENLLLTAFGKKEKKEFDTIIYDLDAYKMDAIFDCGWPISVKNAIIDLVDFRGDMMFFTDLGTKANTLDTIKNVIFGDNSLNNVDGITNSSYSTLYHNYFNIIDPFTKKEITVTMPYLLINKLTNHIAKGVGRPFAGIANGLTFDNIIENSINFLPVVIPGVDEKQELADLNVNYLSMYDGVPVMETMYVNDLEHTQLSYTHNIMAVQEIIKSIRSRCPATRYTFLDGDDLETYITDVQAVVKEYSSNFKNISCEYMADEKYEQNNIFYAVLKVQFKNFIQEEYFKIIAIS